MANLVPGKIGIFTNFIFQQYAMGNKFKIEFYVDGTLVSENRIDDIGRFLNDPYSDKYIITDSSVTEKVSYKIIFDHYIPVQHLQSINYVAFAGHNFNSSIFASGRCEISWGKIVRSDTGAQVSAIHHYTSSQMIGGELRSLQSITDGFSGVNIGIKGDGFGLSSFKGYDHVDYIEESGTRISLMTKEIWVELYKSDSNAVTFGTGTDIRNPILNSIMIGNHWKSDREPNTGSSVSLDSNHYTVKKTTGGKDIINTNYLGRPMFSQAERLPAFELLDDTSGSGVNWGNWKNRPNIFTSLPRKSFKCNFNYFDVDKIFPDHLAQVGHNNDYLYSSVYSGTGTYDSFYEAVIYPTINGQCSVLFCFSTNDESEDTGVMGIDPSSFCMARLSGNELNFQEVAPNLYDIAIEVEEIW
tara:strand:+ start:12420 stop:13658 length:1239 start_codon:yes stop_codon:yes gene_type:complete